MISYKHRIYATEFLNVYIIWFTPYCVTLFLDLYVMGGGERTVYVIGGD